MSEQCQHVLGSYRRKNYWEESACREECGKAATHVAKYPGKPPLPLCRKHAKSRMYVSLINTDAPTVLQNNPKRSTQQV